MTLSLLKISGIASQIEIKPCLYDVNFFIYSLFQFRIIKFNARRIFPAVWDRFLFRICCLIPLLLIDVAAVWNCRRCHHSTNENSQCPLLISTSGRYLLIDPSIKSGLTLSLKVGKLRVFSTFFVLNFLAW